MTASSAFAAVQKALADALSLNTAGIGRPHTIVALPSFNVSETLLSHYADRLPSLEHRYLLALLILRIDGCRLVFLTCRQPPPEVVDLYISLLPAEVRPTAMERFRVVVVDDLSARPVAAKALERPEILAAIRRAVGDTPAFIEPWSVGGYERDLSVALGIPINGTAPELWPLGFKSAGRHLFRRAGVPMPDGFEDLHTVGDAVGAIERLRAAKPGLGAVVLKHDDSGAGDGNAVLDLAELEPAGTTMAARRLRARIKGLPPWYLNELPKGFVAEER
ncbi:MAG TPA: hypothetical protein VMS74_11985, partial [Acidimicrobiia bacterium]|nr:hypothetical protein [Acidimicrobiia bacterium]